MYFKLSWYDIVHFLFYQELLLYSLESIVIKNNDSKLIKKNVTKFKYIKFY